MRDQTDLRVLLAGGDGRATEVALRQSEQSYRALFEQASDGIFVHDAGGRLFEVNPAGCRMTGYSLQELLSMRCTDLATAEDRERMLADIARLEHSVEVLSEWRCHRKNGSTFLAESSSRQRSDGRLQTFLRDIGEQRRLQEQVLEAEKLESGGRLAVGIAHDLNNMMSVVVGWGELMLQDTTPGDPRREPLREIVLAAARTARLAGQIFEIGRNQTLAPGVSDVNVVISDLETTLRRLIPGEVDLDIRLARDAGRVKAGPGRIAQILLNLVVNARDAMPSGGRLAIETANVELGPSTGGDRHEVEPGAYLRLVVSDTGQGMSEAVRARIFEPYFTTKEGGKGSGLGLATVQEIVKHSGGHVSVRSAPGQGSTFEIYFPLVSGPLT